VRLGELGAVDGGGEQVEGGQAAVEGLRGRPGLGVRINLVKLHHVIKYVGGKGWQ